MEMGGLLIGAVAIIIIGATILLTVWSIITVIIYLQKRKNTCQTKFLEALGILSGMYCMYLVVNVLDITFANWDVAIHIVDVQFPIVCTFCIAAMYVGIGLCVVWCVQT